MAPTNKAAWLENDKQYPLVVRDAPYTPPGPDEIVIKTYAAAVNPVDWKLQTYGHFMGGNFPTILGSDAAGIVEEVGPSVAGFKVGDRVMGHAIALATGKPQNGGFQAYVGLPAALACVIPDSLSFEDACVLPLCVNTAAAGLFQNDFLALPHPDVAPKSNGKTLVIWGGSSSVGSCAIQLAKASGCEVVVTASKRNFQYCTDLGADKVLDYNEPSLLEDMVSFLNGKEIVGIYDAISDAATLKTCGEILKKTGGVQTIACVLPGNEKLESNVPGVVVKSLFATSIKENEVGPAIWTEYLPKALESSKFKAKPSPLVIGKGLEYVQQGLDKNKQGVSAAKVVITL